MCFEQYTYYQPQNAPTYNVQVLWLLFIIQPVPINVEPIPNAVTASSSVVNDIYVVPVSLNVEPLPNAAAPVSNSITPISVGVGTPQASHTNLVSATPEVSNQSGVEQSQKAVTYSKSYGVAQTTAPGYAHRSSKPLLQFRDGSVIVSAPPPVHSASRRDSLPVQQNKW